MTEETPQRCLVMEIRKLTEI